MTQAAYQEKKQILIDKYGKVLRGSDIDKICYCIDKCEGLFKLHIWVEELKAWGNF